MSSPGTDHQPARPGARLLALVAAAVVPLLLVIPAQAQDVAAQATLVGTSPLSGAGSVGLTPAVSATFDGTVTEPSLRFTVTGPAGAVPGQVSLADAGRTARFVPAAPLDPGAAYTASVQADEAPATHTWTFTTGSPRPAACPCTIWDDFTTPDTAATSDAAAVELGMKVYFTSRGEVLGVRFHKGPGNTGTHTGSFWTAAGQLLATGTFTGETATGWQTLLFDAPVVVEPGPTYVVSYFAPGGRYSMNQDHFGTYGRVIGYNHIEGVVNSQTNQNGVFRYGGGMPTTGYRASNYWVDVVYRHGTNGDHTRPALGARSPAADETGVAVAGVLTLEFDEAIDLAATQVRLVDDGQGTLYGTSALSADGRTVTWTPNGPLAPGTRYTARVLATDVNGNAMASPATWAFTTGAATSCPCSLFSEATSPGTTAFGQGIPVELGVRFGSSTPGAVTGVKFYKAAGNTGAHTGSLWTDQGVLLATGTFTDETDTGWQTLTFATPVAIEADQVYVASYYSPTGRHSATNHYFGTRPQVVSAPLWTAPGAYANGRYRTGTGFPDQHYIGNNYWVDVVVTTG
ncbi:DUF4082 domain-containing protein [Saccharothrix sp. 6-C]|uniref:DUF4082 domain-containing protein n=1 Tax=Saccharothrix sp. 6-C TaxID=2781735 RepID=UPI0019179332|nr:DUF4082 domain-containing protein [Saccharothrix sp. 6-C]QQQ79915.1 DUF4082 domain-containing protein [Saccharothrix sp. 6-C]